ncbi:MAG: [NiFe]-hydrogenase assembly chaperone HybE [Azonexaceae bacterium]|nr:[NiFe]-hydrogenase assembly chaperone HybE [Azonexaceae bacterium]
MGGEQMMFWTTDPSPELVAAFDTIARTRMHDVPICNRKLQVEALGFQRRPDGHWAGAMITPWAINLLCLPGQAESWPALAACSKHDWHFPSGDYEFTVAEEGSIGIYHLCSLFSPALEFDSHEAARLTALAAAHALFADPLAEPPVARTTSRRAFLGLGR